MKQDNANWKRLSEVIRVTGHNVNSFARHIGLPRGENLYHIQRGNNGISYDVATRIHDNYPEYPVEWLMHGIEQLPFGQVVRIPLYYNYAAMIFPTHEAADEMLILATTLRPSEFADIVVTREQVTGLWLVVGAVCNWVR